MEFPHPESRHFHDIGRRLLSGKEKFYHDSESFPVQGFYKVLEFRDRIFSFSRIGCLRCKQKRRSISPVI